MKASKPRKTSQLEQAVAAGIAVAAVVVALFLSSPRATANNDEAAAVFDSLYAAPPATPVQQAAAPQNYKLDKKFKGKLPITQLSEDEAITHALTASAMGRVPVTSTTSVKSASKSGSINSFIPRLSKTPSSTSA